VADKLNPKGVAGRKKTSYLSIPPSFMKYLLVNDVNSNLINELASAMDEGARKYGIRNWMDDKIHLSDYYNSSLRHYIAWKGGEKIDEDSGLNHITKIISGLIVVYDSISNSFYNDDRIVSVDDIDNSSVDSLLIDWFNSESKDVKPLFDMFIDLRCRDGFGQDFGSPILMNMRQTPNFLVGDDSDFVNDDESHKSIDDKIKSKIEKKVSEGLGEDYL